MHRPAARTVGIVAAALVLAAVGAAGATAALTSGTAPARLVTAYVVNSDGTVTPINTATNTPGRAIRLLPAWDYHDNLTSIGITPSARTAYVLSVGQRGTLTPISTTANMPGTPIPTTAVTQVMAFTQTGRRSTWPTTTW